MRVLIVDDSVVFRSTIKTALSNFNEIEVVGTANNGKIALLKLQESLVDLITMDIEMPELGGIDTIKEIRRLKNPVKIIVFASTTARGTQSALEALAAGADDFVAKPYGEGGFEQAVAKIQSELIPKIFQFFSLKISNAEILEISKTKEKQKPYSRKNLDTFIPSLIVIGSSTGGPQALERVLVGLKSPTRIPIIIAQHMPPDFTLALAKRLESLTGIPTTEAKDQEVLSENHIYIAPGNFHLKIIRKGNDFLLALDQGPLRNFVRPAVDTLFESAAEHFMGRTMAFVLTGMGEDGLVGVRAIKEKGGGVMIQNRESCIVFGMPGAIFQENLQDEIGGFEAINNTIKHMGL